MFAGGRGRDYGCCRLRPSDRGLANPARRRRESLLMLEWPRLCADDPCSIDPKIITFAQETLFLIATAQNKKQIFSGLVQMNRNAVDAGHNLFRFKLRVGVER